MKSSSVIVLLITLAVGRTACAADPMPETAPSAAPAWREVAPGVWRAVVGTPDAFNLLGAAGGTPRLEALRALPLAAFPLDPAEVAARAFSGKTALRFPLAGDEELYGLGVDFKTLRRTGSTFQLHVDHWGGQTGRTHAPVPFYVSSRGYGVLINAARYLNFNVGTSVRLAAKTKPPVIDRTTGGGRWTAMPRSDSVEVLVPAAGVEVLVFAGPTPLDAVRRFNLFSGGGALPPKWGLGFMTRTPTRTTAAEALAEVAEFRRRGIPLDMLGLEPGWQDHAYPGSFEWDPTRFPDPAGFAAEMARQHVRLNLWFNPYVSPTAQLYAKLRPFAGSHLVWNGLVPDYTLPEARRIFSDHLRKIVLALGPALSGFKIDEVDGGDRWLWPDLAAFPSGRDAEQLRQTYGVLLQRLVLDLYRAENRRTFGQVRGSNAGAAPLPFVLYNDNYDFNEYITAVGNAAFAGVLWSPEVRGGGAEDMLRRVQAVCFAPLALYNGWASKEKLWTHPAVADAIRDAIVLRQRLLPYLYTAFAQYHFTGTPVVRPMPLLAAAPAVREEAGELDATANPYALARTHEVRDQYLLGDALLVAPIAPGVRSRRVVLPAGKWFDFHTGRFAGEGETIEVTPPPDRLPVFVADGALVPLLPARQWAPGRDEVLPLEVRHYGERPGRLALYDDDGESFDYERGAYSWTELKVTRDGAGAWHGTVTPDPRGRRWSYGEVTWTFLPPR